MNKNFFLFLIITGITMSIVACKKDSEKANYEIWIIATVKVRIYSFVDSPDGKKHWVEYILDSFKYENDELELNLPDTVPNEYLSQHLTGFMDVSKSDPYAKWARVSINAYNSVGNSVGSFGLVSNNWVAQYIYSDRSFTTIGNYYSTEYDCSYEKGLNIVYKTFREETTQKPLNENFKWKFVRNM